MEHHLPDAYENSPITVAGSIASLPEGHVAGESLRFEFEIEQSIPNHIWPHPGRVKLRWDDASHLLKVGERWRWTVKLKRPHGYANPGSFDKERHFFLNRISAEGVVLAQYPVQKLDELKNTLSFRSLKSFINRLRDNIFTAIFSALNDSPLSGIIAGLVVGTREGISANQWGVFRETGTAHLMAISGLHVGLVAGIAFALVHFLYQFLPLICFRIPSPISGALFSIFAAFSYALLAGFTVPTQRAVIMVTVFMLSRVFRHRISPWRSFYLALGIVLLLDPLSSLSPGFWLSFAAVGTILYGLQGRIAAKGIWWKWGRPQWVVFLGLAPVSLLIFKQISWVAPIANLIAIPWVSTLVVPFALLGGIIVPFYPKLGSLFLWLANFSFSLLWPFLEACQKLLPQVTWSQAEARGFELALALVGVLLLLAPKGFPARKLAIVFCLPLLLNKTASVQPNSVRFTLLDVGQGLSAVVETAEHVLVFDTGPKLNDHFDTGEQVVLPYLASLGKSKIDTIVISHADNDHIGGLHSILKKVSTLNILTSDVEKTAAVLATGDKPSEPVHTIKNCYEGQQWTWDGVHFEMLHPGTLFTQKKNDRSCVLKIQAGEHAILLTGDIEAKVENALISRFPEKLSSSILVVPHHGSQSSSSQAFIEAVDPIYAIIPVGYKNQYGHPKQQVLERYRNQGAIILDTINDGMMSFEITPKLPIAAPIVHRKEHRYFWSKYTLRE